MSSYDIVSWSRLHSRELQWLLMPFQRALKSTSSYRIPLPSVVIDSLLWWTSEAVTKSCMFREPHRIVIMTDASLFGWGAHLGPHMAQGCRSQQDRILNINILELQAIYLALLSFEHHVLGRNVLILTDNISAKVHINRLGGTRSRALMQETLCLGLWSEAHLASLQA